MSMKKAVFIIVILLLMGGISFFFFKQSIKTPDNKKPVITATPTIGQLPMQETDEVFLGEITEVTGKHFILSVEDKYYDIALADRTYFKKGKKSDIAIGTKLGVIASPERDETYIARTIVINASSSAEVLK